MKITRALWICAFAVAVIDCLLIRAAVFESQRRNSGTVSSTAFLSSTASRYERAQAQTILVETDHGFGSGVVIERQGRVFVWTAAHVVKNTAKVVCHRALRYRGQKAGEMVFPGHVLVRLPGVDAALLLLEAPPQALAGAQWGDSAPLAVGTPLFHVGNLYGPAFDGSVTLGIVSQTGICPNLSNWPDNWQVIDQATTPCAPGSSGGPIFTKDGRIVGLVVGGPGQGAAGITCFVPVRELERAAEEADVPWALWGDYCPSDKALAEAIKIQEKLVETEQEIDLILSPVPEEKP